MESYSFLAIKLTMGIIGLVLQINLMGKGNLAPTSAMDQVQNYVLGGIIGAVIYNDNIGILQFSLVLILWTLLIFTLRFIKNHNRFVKNIIGVGGIGGAIIGIAIILGLLYFANVKAQTNDEPTVFYSSFFQRYHDEGDG